MSNVVPSADRSLPAVDAAGAGGAAAWVAATFGLAAVCGERRVVNVALPGNNPPWRVGLIVGASGTGKTSTARAWLGDDLGTPEPWPADRAVVEALAMPPAAAARLLASVGLGSPPAWLRPHRALSTGERFRCDVARRLARAVALGRATIGIDEFANSLDRRGAAAVAAAVARTIRRECGGPRLVAITAHDDIARWLAPDWTLNMDDRRLSRQGCRPPPIALSLGRGSRGAWGEFAPHHYLSGDINPAARCYMGRWLDRPVVFVALLPLIGHRGRWRVTRLVTLPAYQGLGLGMAALEAIGCRYRADGLRLSITTGHPALTGHCGRSPCWKETAAMPRGGRPTRTVRGYRSSAGRPVQSFEYLGGAVAPSNIVATWED